jgi:phage tail-like protein
MAWARKDPLTSHSFLVEIDGVASAFFKEATRFGFESEVIEFRELGNPLSSHKLPGRVTFSNVTLKRGLTTSLDLWNWRQAVVDGNVQRHDVTITLLDGTGKPLRSLRLREAWPMKWEMSELDASKNDVVIESITLCHEGFEIQ